jgi:hypothetical protein
MGLLKETAGRGGLLLPIVAHTIADYYIFTTIARRPSIATTNTTNTTTTTTTANGRKDIKQV